MRAEKMKKQNLKEAPRARHMTAAESDALSAHLEVIVERLPKERSSTSCSHALLCAQRKGINFVVFRNACP